MLPKISNTVAWQQAELLMQPAFIRIIDHIGKHLDQSTWKGTYQDVLIWPDGTTDDTKIIVEQLLQQVESASPTELAEIKQALSQLPTPHPGYHLCLQRQGLPHVNIDLWELCYQVCFRNYSPSLPHSAPQGVQIDVSLIDEVGDVDWQRLDAKAGELVEQIFTNLV